MSTVCPACGTENRDKARYCRGCARALVPLPGQAGGDAPVVQPAEKPSKASSAVVPAAATATGSAEATGHRAKAGAPLGWIAGTLLVAGLVGWQFWPRVASTDPTNPAAFASSTAAETPAESRALMQTSAAGPASSTAPRGTPATTSGATPKLKPTPAPEPGVRQATAPKPKPARPAKVAAKDHAVAEPVTPAPPVAPAPVAKVAPTPAPVPTRPHSVEEDCADRSNFLTRDFCRIQACNNPAMAGDPVCVRFRQMEAANRERLGN